MSEEMDSSPEAIQRRLDAHEQRQRERSINSWKARAEKAEAALQESAAAHVHALTAIGAVRQWAKVQAIESTSRGDYGKRRVFLDLLIVLENNGYGDAE